ncbi:hypothetical protein ACFSQD_12590 [Flavihumibacter stibioxidans]|uniref:hypothetical protein n=1 Tax=Flavihumibacter stibioxidans TaxID=1834163 RepID=UPI00164F8ACB|nr:hypothetical protein [Flavihumibacter stibioxidans]
MSFTTIKIFSGLLLFLVSTALQAQDIMVKASVSKDRILIGEPIVLKLEAEIPKSSETGWFKVDSIEHFDYLKQPVKDTQINVNAIIFKELFTITSFDSGSWTIPRYSITINNNRYLTDSIRIDVGYSPADPSQPYHDIRDIVEVPETEQLYINYIIAVVTLLAIAALIWLLRRKRKTAGESPVQTGPRLTPYERATAELASLKASGLPAAGQLKQFYTRLNDILRTYFREQQLVTSPDASNEQLVVGVKSRLDNESVYRLAQSLRLADAVKFARYEPGVNEHEQVFNDIKESIENIETKIRKTPSA